MSGGALRGNGITSLYLCNLDSDAGEGVDWKACPKMVGFMSRLTKDQLEYV